MEEWKHHDFHELMDSLAVKSSTPRSVQFEQNFYMRDEEPIELGDDDEEEEEEEEESSRRRMKRVRPTNANHAEKRQRSSSTTSNSSSSSSSSSVIDIDDDTNDNVEDALDDQNQNANDDRDIMFVEHVRPDGEQMLALAVLDDMCAELADDDRHAYMSESLRNKRKRARCKALLLRLFGRSNWRQIYALLKRLVRLVLLYHVRVAIKPEAAASPAYTGELQALRLHILRQLWALEGDGVRREIAARHLVRDEWLPLKCPVCCETRFKSRALLTWCMHIELEHSLTLCSNDANSMQFLVPDSWSMVPLEMCQPALDSVLIAATVMAMPKTVVAAAKTRYEDTFLQSPMPRFEVTPIAADAQLRLRLNLPSTMLAPFESHCVDFDAHRDRDVLAAWVNISMLIDHISRIFRYVPATEEERVIYLSDGSTANLPSWLVLVRRLRRKFDQVHAPTAPHPIAARIVQQAVVPMPPPSVATRASSLSSSSSSLPSSLSPSSSPKAMPVPPQPPVFHHAPPPTSMIRQVPAQPPQMFMPPPPQFVVVAPQFASAQPLFLSNAGEQPHGQPQLLSPPAQQQHAAAYHQQLVQLQQHQQFQQQLELLHRQHQMQQQQQQQQQYNQRRQ
jgi:hypothetical protein